MREQHAGGASVAGSQREGLHLDAHDVGGGGSGGDLVISDRDHRPPDMRAAQPDGQQHRHRQRREQQVVVAGVGVHLVAQQGRAGDRADPVGAAQEGIPSIGHDPEADIEAQRGQRQVVPGQPQQRKPDQRAQCAGKRDRSRRRGPDRHAVSRRHDRGGVGAHPHEPGLREADQPGPSEDEVQPQHGDGRDQGGVQHVQREPRQDRRNTQRQQEQQGGDVPHCPPSSRGREGPAPRSGVGGRGCSKRGKASAWAATLSPALPLEGGGRRALTT